MSVSLSDIQKTSFAHHQSVQITDLRAISTEASNCTFISCFDFRIQRTLLALKQNLYPNQVLYPIALPAAIKLINLESDYFFRTILNFVISKLQIRDIVLVTHLDCKGYDLTLDFEGQIKHHVNELMNARRLIINQYGATINITTICVPSLVESAELISEVIVVQEYTTTSFANLG